jgi:hypothetical protein
MNNKPNREAVILVRIDNMDTLASEGQMSIRLPLTEIGPETIAEWVASALREVPDPIHWGEKWSAY